MKTKTTIYISLCIAMACLGLYLGSKWFIKKQDIEKEKIEGDTELESSHGNDLNFDNNGVIPSSDHFSIDEYNSKDGIPVPPELYGNVQTLMNQMEIVRSEFGNRPIHINSGYRSPAHNKEVGGVINSQHLLGKANDFTISGYTPAQVKNKMEILITEGKILPGGLGLYPNFVHYDIRGTNARWSS